MDKMTRRSFLKTIGLGGPAVLLLGKVSTVFAGKWEHAKKNFWKGNSFVQKSVDMSGYDRGLIRAKVDGKWSNFTIRETSSDFIDWNRKRRLEFLENIKTGKMPELGGPHSGSVASYGLGRLDSQFTLNNAVKGIGLAPKDDNLDKAIKKLKDTYQSSLPEKMDILKSFYDDAGNIDWRKQTSLELYSEPDFETHSFLNLMDNPVATIVFLDIPSYELRTIGRVISPDDPSALPSEKKLLEYVNLAHSYMHGEFSKTFPLLLFYVIEEFDNTPGTKLGVRSVPPSTP
jgi:hypothetical protein